MPQLDPSNFASQLFWLFATFLLLFLVAWKVALPRITEVLNARQERIDDDLEKAEGLKSEAEEVLAAYERSLADARSEAQEAHRKVVQELAEEQARRLEALSRTLSDRTSDAEDRIAGEKAQAVENIREATLDVVRSATERLIGVRVADQEADSAIQAAIRER